MRLVVVGAAGQLGSDLIAAAEAGAGSVRGLGREDLDVTDADAVSAVLGGLEFDALINCAAYNDTAGAELDCKTAFQVNARAPGLLAGAAADAGARFVHISTDYVFDGLAGRPYVEADPPAPLGVYGASKLTGEALARRAHPQGTLVIRTAALFGVAAVPRRGNFVETILDAARPKGEEARRLRGVDDVIVSPTATTDLAAGVLGLLGADAPPDLYHLVNEGQASWFDFARSIVELAGLDAEVEPVPAATYASPVRRPPFSVLDAGKATAVTGSLPHWKDGLARYLVARAQVASSGSPER